MTRPRIVRPTVAARDVPRETHDEGCRLFCAAVAELGYAVESRWDEHQHVYLVRPNPPLHVLNQARILALDALGVPWEWATPYDEDGDQ